LNNNTGKIEVGLVEEVYADKENTDQPIIIKSACHSPYIVSVAIIRNESQAEDDQQMIVLLDPDQTEM
jgi:hypothetical protein